MSLISSVALSGLDSISRSLQASAHNVANASTPGFTRQEVLRSADAAGGVSTRLRNAAVPGAELERDLVQQMQLSYEFKANILSLKAENERLGSLLDLSA